MPLSTAVASTCSRMCSLAFSSSQSPSGSVAALPSVLGSPSSSSALPPSGSSSGAASCLGTCSTVASTSPFAMCASQAASTCPPSARELVGQLRADLAKLQAQRVADGLQLVALEAEVVKQRDSRGAAVRMVQLMKAAEKDAASPHRFDVVNRACSELQSKCDALKVAYDALLGGQEEESGRAGEEE